MITSQYYITATQREYVLLTLRSGSVSLTVVPGHNITVFALASSFVRYHGIQQTKTRICNEFIRMCSVCPNANEIIFMAVDNGMGQSTEVILFRENSYYFDM